MKKYLPIVVTIVAIIAVTVINITFFGTKNVEEYQGKTLPIKWEEVNVRIGHSLDEDILLSLPMGKSIVLTGVRYDSPWVLDDVPSKSWTQIQLGDGTTGWIVTESIQWH